MYIKENVYIPSYTGSIVAWGFYFLLHLIGGIKW